uniref:Uncharacterized protein n=1 Tax=Anguilla anguilla TaxID=7936 RepID=A0A0E9T3C6_ANGAN
MLLVKKLTVGQKKKKLLAYNHIQNFLNNVCFCFAANCAHIHNHLSHKLRVLLDKGHLRNPGNF